MSPAHPSTPVPIPLPIDCLATLVAIAEARLAGDDPAGSSLLRVRVDDHLGEVEVGWLPLADGEHPLERLVGEVVPEDWCAVGVAATGVARSFDQPPRDPVRVRSVHLVGRDGAWASRLAPAGGEPIDASGAAGDPGRPVGRIDDACRRALRLPTDPAPASTAELWTLQWLDAIVGSGPGGGRARRWRDVAALHPAVGALRSDAGEDPPSPSRLASLAHQLATWRDWALLRRAAAAGVWAAPGLDPRTAGWLDDGSFARWVLGAYPDLDDLLEAAAQLLPPSVVQAIEDVVDLGGGRR